MNIFYSYSCTHVRDTIARDEMDGGIYNIDSYCQTVLKHTTPVCTPIYSFKKCGFFSPFSTVDIII